MKSKIKLVLLCTLFVLILPLKSVQADVNRPNQTVERYKIKVALPIQYGYAYENDGFYSGYTVDYLYKIAQIAPIDFEFVTMENTNDALMNALDMVKNKEIDIIGAVFKSPSMEEDYNFSNIPYGSSSYALLSREECLINERSFKDSDRYRVGLYSNAKMINGAFANYVEQEGLVFEIVNYDTVDAVDAALANKDVDIILGRDTAKHENSKIVTTFGKQDIYFMSGKDNEEVLDIINQAMYELDLIDEEFTDSLQKKYFYTASTSPNLTVDEKSLIKELPPLRVGVTVNSQPLQYYSEASQEYRGILVDILKVIAQRLEIELEWVAVGSSDDLLELIRKKEIDVFLGIPTRYEIAEQADILLTSPIISLPLVRIYNENTSVKNDEVLISEYLYFNDEKAIKGYGDEEIMQAISDGTYTSAIVGAYRAKYLSPDYKNVSLSLSSYDSYDVSIGISKWVDSRLVSIFEQGIKTISVEEREDIIYNYAYKEAKTDVLSIIRRDPIFFVVTTLVIAGSFILVLMTFLYKTDKMIRAINHEKEEYERLSRIDQLTGVYNQQTFKNIVQKALEAGDKGILVTVDIDSFKQINDTYGHLEGDRILSEIGIILKEHFKDDVTGRLGGDEFMVYINHHESEETLRIVLNELLKKVTTINVKKIITMSIGVLYFYKASHFDDVYHQVDGLLYSSKSMGKNKYSIEYMDKSHAFNKKVD